MAKIWYATDCNIYTHPKTLALAAALNLDIDTTVGKLGRLWAWAMLSENETGDISHLPASEIASIMRWKKRPEGLVDALIACGFLDRGSNTMIHDWEDLNGKFIAKKRKERERKNG